jgi:hypothetical protein
MGPEFPDAIEPLFTTPTPNQEVEILNDRATIKSSSDFSVSGDCRLIRRWLPSPETAIQLRFSEPLSISFVLRIWQEQASEPFPQILLEGFPGNPAPCLITVPGKNELIAHVTGNWFLAKAEKLHAVYFHLVNVPFIRGHAIRHGSTGFSAGRVELHGGDWVIAIDPVSDHRAIYDAVTDSGGFGITHVGRLGTVSGREFAHDEVSNILHALWRFLSFAQGCWVGPVLAVGVNGCGERCWWDLSPVLCDPRKSIVGWFRHRDATSLEQLWPLFFAKWQNTYWNDVLCRGIWWYVGGSKQAGGTDGAIVLIQAGLELFAWVNLVEIEKRITAREFGTLSAGEKLCRLLGAMKLGIDFPEGLQDLKSFAQKQGWATAPRAFTEVRNRLVHPKNRCELDRAEAINDAYWLGMHYLELAIL